MSGSMSDPGPESGGRLSPCCRRNHPLTEDNTYIRRNGKGLLHRACRVCARQRRRDARAAARAAKAGPAAAPFLTGRPPAWMDAGACLSADPELFFPEVGRKDQAEAAKRVCVGCPVRGECLEYALEIGELREGVYGGLSPAERQALARQRRGAAA